MSYTQETLVSLIHLPPTKPGGWALLTLLLALRKQWLSFSPSRDLCDALVQRPSISQLRPIIGVFGLRDCYAFVVVTDLVYTHLIPNRFRPTFVVKLIKCQLHNFQPLLCKYRRRLVYSGLDGGLMLIDHLG